VEATSCFWCGLLGGDFKRARARGGTGRRVLGFALDFMADEDASADEASSFSSDGSTSMNDGACF